MSNKKSLKTNKTFEENQAIDICNYEIRESLTETHEVARLSPKATKEKGNYSYSESKKSDKNVNKKKKRSSSRSNEKTEKPFNKQNSYIIEMLDSLQEKITIYENEIKSLIEEKVEMQIQINDLRISSYNNLKKSSKLKKSGENPLQNQSVEFINGLKKSYFEEATGLKAELENYNIEIAKQKKLLDVEYSILNETISNTNSLNKDSYFQDNYKGIQNDTRMIKKNSNFNQNLEVKNNESFCIINSTNEVEILQAQREIMMQEINNLKTDLMFLMQSQQELAKIANKKKEKEDDDVDEEIPQLNQIFKMNNKNLVLDSYKDIWHLKKCKKYKRFVQNNLERFNGNKEEIFNAFIEDQQNNSENMRNSKEGLNNNNQNILIDENDEIDDDYNKNQIEEERKIYNETENENNFEQDQKEMKNDCADDFEVSKITDISMLEKDVNFKKMIDIRSDARIKNKEEANNSLELSADSS